MYIETPARKMAFKSHLHVIHKLTKIKKSLLSDTFYIYITNTVQYVVSIATALPIVVFSKVELYSTAQPVAVDCGTHNNVKE